MAAAFHTISVPNTDAPTIYSLSIREPGLSLAPYATFVFPLSPQMLRAEYPALTNHYYVQGSDPSMRGVQVIADNYGTAPPVILIEGTTGWKRHGATGFVTTGLEDIQQLKGFLAEFDSLNQEQMQNGVPDLYTLELYDYFQGEFWQVVPEGPQLIWQTRERPLLTYYRFRLLAIQPVDAPIGGLFDALLQTFATPATSAIISAASAIGSFVSHYSPVGELG